MSHWSSGPSPGSSEGFAQPFDLPPRCSVADYSFQVEPMLIPLTGTQSSTVK